MTVNVGNGDNGDASLFLLYSGCRPHKKTHFLNMPIEMCAD